MRGSPDPLVIARLEHELGIGPPKRRRLVCTTCGEPLGDDRYRPNDEHVGMTQTRGYCPGGLVVETWVDIDAVA